ncbi:MAG: hypothetical protein KG003_05045 [Bacteroidetes bacterium]|nr:hypothetical protein [Bacteroidota bacterium]
MKKTIYRILLMTIAVAAQVVSAQTIQEGRRLTRNEQFEDAEVAFNQMIAAKPKNGEAYYWAGINYLESGDTIAAAKMFNEGLLRAPKYSLNQVGKGHLMLRANKLTEAQALFTLGLKTGKKLKPTVNREIGRAYLMASEMSKAIKVRNAKLALEALKLGPEGDFEVKLLEGDALFIVNDEDKTPAVTKYIESGYINGESPIPLLREALVYQRVRNLDLAMIRVDEALQKDANFAPGYRQKAEVFADMKKRDSAVIYFKEYLKRNNNLSARRKYVNALFFNQQYNDAIMEAKELLKIKEIPTLYGVIAYAIAEKMDTSKALNKEGLEYFEKYEEKVVNPANRGLSASEKFFKGALLHRSGNRDAGWELQKQALTDTANASNRWYDLAREMNYSSRNYPRVIEIILMKYSKTKATPSLDQFFLAMSYRLSGQYSESNQIFSQILQKDTSYLKGYHYLALNWALLDPKDSTGNVEQAYLTWMGRMKDADKVTYKKDMEYAYLTLADLKSKKGAESLQLKEEKEGGFPKSKELYKKSIEYYKMAAELNPTDTSLQDQINILDKFVKDLEKRKPKKR